MHQPWPPKGMNEDLFQFIDCLRRLYIYAGLNVDGLAVHAEAAFPNVSNTKFPLLKPFAP